MTLADLVREIGYSCSATVENFNSVIEMSGEPLTSLSAQQVHTLFTTAAPAASQLFKQHSNTLDTWNTVCIIHSLLQAQWVSPQQKLEYISSVIDPIYLHQQKTLLDRLALEKVIELLPGSLTFVEQNSETVLQSLSIHNFNPDLYFKLIIPYLLTDYKNNLLSTLWNSNKQMLQNALVQLYQKDYSKMSRILDIVGELKALPYFLKASPLFFSIDLASLASRREYLNLEKWCGDMQSEAFTKAVCEFLYEKIVVLGDVGSKDVINTFLNVLESSSLRQENAEMFQEILNAYSKTSNKNAAEVPKSEFAHDVEEEANGYFVRIYKGEIRIPQLIELLARYKNSSNRREVDVCNCIIHYLFDEYKFFSRYPEKELVLTSILFGSLIQHQIVSAMALGNALRHVLEAARLPPATPLFIFALHALRQFQSRLPEWPQYCSLLLQIPNFDRNAPDIVSYIKQPNGEPVDPNSVIPNEATQDKILFLINNLSPSSIDSKLTEMREVLKVEYSAWFCDYLVNKRVSIEPNYHTLYIQFVDGINEPKLDAYVLHETYRAIKSLLVSEKTVTSSEERTLLKNLGMWLGLLTLSKNIPIRFKHLAFKELLLEGYDTQRLIVVIPFVCKVLEQCTNSVFAPPNPWLMAVMKLLSELYHFADLKLNLKFEIEVLCKNLKLDVNDITPTSLLKSRPLQQGAGVGLQMAFEQMSIGGPSQQQQQQQQQQQGLPVPTPGGGPAGPQGASGNTAAEEDINIVYPNLASFITFNPQLQIFQTQPALKRIVHFALEKAIKEIINPVVDRSVTIAGIATRELVVKDFALESDENKMRKSAHLMVQSLSGSLASVTCREPLRISIIQNLKTLLAQNGVSESVLSEASIFGLAADNLELACSVVEKSASEKAIAEIDESLAANFNVRRKSRERTGQPYYDIAVFSASRYPATLPEILRLKPGGLTNNQLRVYEDFARLPRLLGNGGEGGNGNLGDQRGRNGSGEFAEDVPYATPQAVEKFTQYLVQLEKTFPQVEVGSVTALPPQHDIHNILLHAPLLVTQSYNRDEVALILSQRILNLLFKHESQLPLETYVLLLERVCETSKKVSKEVFQWLLFNDDERKYNLATFVTILQARLLAVPELDMQLARHIDAGSVKVIDFTERLMRRCVLEEPVLATQNDFFNCIDMFAKLNQRGKAPDNVIRFLDDIDVLNNATPIKDLVSNNGKIENLGGLLREQFVIMFADWVRFYHHPSSTEKSQLQHVGRMISQGVLQSEDVSSLFFRVCTEQSIEIYLKNKASNGPHVFAYQAVDALARLIILIVRLYNNEPTDTSGAASPNSESMISNSHTINIAKVNLATKILSIILLVLVHSHEKQKLSFNQRPLFRLFSTLLNDLHAFGHTIGPIYFQILSALSNTFHTLQPSFLPGFTFSWLQLVSHRHFMSKLLTADNQKGWPFYQRLVIDLFKYLAPFLRSREFTDPVRLLYRGTLRTLLVLLHDFPEFLCCYHFSFMDIIPHTCIQLRNLVLSAFPVGMKLPDPFSGPSTPMPQEFQLHPQVLSDYTAGLAGTKGELDAYLKTRTPVSFLMGLKGRFVSGDKYQVHVINALVLYVGVYAINEQQCVVNPDDGQFIIKSCSAVDIFQQLATDLDSEGRYLFLCAIANQLRYPNSHTNFFSQLILYMFSEAKQEIIQEQITRVLLERLIVNRPHPHGLLVTFVELIRNQNYNFWDHTRFIKCSPEIEKLFNSVAKSVNLSYVPPTSAPSSS